MSTRSSISVFDKGLYTTVYCHNDGYLSYNGKILLEHYNDLKKVKRLVGLGDMSVLGDDPQTCYFYHRDRNEEWQTVSPSKCEKLSDIITQEFNYVFAGGNWFYFFEDRTEKPMLKILTKDFIDDK